ncbi:MAG TPA: ABC transporter permease [Candidatus Saccharibacteria bacterium]|jgi:putative ABC transport system permease protein|nr:transporter permease [Patescibacteria group bacterium]HMS30875.1 ABC transporter permease [Candidatus Saccharibacteria bacterium]
MKVVDIARRAGRSLRHAKIRTILTALAIGVGAFTLTLTLAASTGAKSFIDQVISDNFDPAELIVAKDKAVFGANSGEQKPKEYDPNVGTSASNAGALIQISRLTQEDLDALRATKGIEYVREGVTVNAAYITRPDQKKFSAVLQAFSPSQQPETVAGSVPKSLAGNKILIPEAFVDPLGFESAEQAIGKTLQAAVRKSALNSTSTAPELVTEEFTIVAVLKKPTTSQPGTELYLYIDNEDAVRLNDISTQGTPEYRKYASVYVRVSGGEDSKVLTAVQDRLKEDGYVTLSAEETQKFLLQFISVLEGIVVGFAFLAVIASVFGVINTQYISVLERTQQIGLMKALGMSRRDVAWLFRFEAAWIGLLGGLLGAVLAVGLGTIANPWITEAIQLGEGNNLLIFQPKPIAAVVLGLMVVAVVAGILPARKAGRLDPVEALRTE